MAPSSNSSGLIDDEGNLLGSVNVVDALVFLLVFTVVVAGGTLVLGAIGDTGPETATTFVTLDMGTQPEYIVSALDEGDTYRPSEDSKLTVTDLYVTPQDEQTRVVARAKLRGITHNDTITYTDAPPTLGRTLAITTTAYNLTGNITDAGDQPTLDTGTTTVVLRDRVSAADASEIRSGDEVTVGDFTVATVEDVAVYPTTNPDRRRVLVEATLSSYTRGDTPRFGGTTLRPGQRVRLPTAEYTINGTVDRVGTGLQSRELTNRTVTLELSRVRAGTANAIQAGQTERLGTVPTASVTDVETEPAQVISTTQDGSVVVNDHPTLSDVTLTAELRVAETESGLQFRGERIQLHSTVVLDFGSVTVEPTVVAIGR